MSAVKPQLMIDSSSLRRPKQPNSDTPNEASSVRLMNGVAGRELSGIGPASSTQGAEMSGLTAP